MPRTAEAVERQRAVLAVGRWMVRRGICALVAGVVAVGFQAEERATTAHAVVPGAITAHTNAQGFDGCQDTSQATTAQMAAWWPSTPYYVAYVYVGGEGGQLCGPGGVNATWVDTVTNQGWTLAPIWWGQQPNCAGGGMSLDLNTATSQGERSADLAMTTLGSLGFYNNTIAYDDIEYFDHGNQACAWSVNAYVNGWTYEMHTYWLNTHAGVYVNPYDAVDFPNIANVPNDAWFASFQSPPNQTPWNIPGISNIYWVHDQRHHQFIGTHYETHGGVTLRIDNDCANGLVSPFSYGDGGDRDDSATTDDPTEDPTC